MRRALTFLTGALFALTLGVVSIPIVAVPALACTPVWSFASRHDTYVTVYDRNKHQNATLQYSLVIQDSGNCPGPSLTRQSTTVQINDGTAFNASVTVHGRSGYPSCNINNGSSNAAPSGVTIFTVYGPQIVIADDPCAYHASDQDTYIYSRLAADGAPYFQPAYGNVNVATQNGCTYMFSWCAASYVAPDTL